VAQRRRLLFFGERQSGNETARLSLTVTCHYGTEQIEPTTIQVTEEFE
jgi:hypothetical protein